MRRRAAAVRLRIQPAATLLSHADFAEQNSDEVRTEYRSPPPSPRSIFLVVEAVVNAICLNGRTRDCSLWPEVRFALIHDATSVTGTAWR